MSLRSVIIFAGIGLLARASVAGGFSVNETGSRYAGRGNAVVAVSDSSISALVNPANLAALRGFQLELGATLIFPRFEYTDLTGGKHESSPGVVTPPALTASYTFADLPGVGDLALGLGVFTPYGSTLSWPDDWVHNQAIQTLSLMAFEISPVVAVRPHRAVAIGAGFRLMPATLYMRRAVLFADQAEGSVELAGSGTAYGATAGATVWPFAGLAIAFAWRSPATLSASGDSDLDFPAPFEAQAEDRALEGRLPFPAVYRLGVAWDVMPRLNASADLEYQAWHTYEELALVFIGADGERETVADVKSSKDSLLFHLGAEYRLGERWRLRAGYVWDQRTLPEETVNPAPPDSDRHILALGASFFWQQLGFHVHFADVFFVPRETLANRYRGTWRGGLPLATTAYLISLGFSLELPELGGVERSQP